MNRTTSAIISRASAKELLEIQRRQLEEYTKKVDLGLHRVDHAQRSLRDHERLLEEAESILRMMKDGVRSGIDASMSDTDVAIPAVVARSLVETTRTACKHLTNRLEWDRKELAEAQGYVDDDQRYVEDASELIAVLERALG